MKKMRILLLFICIVASCSAKILRNNALMSKMVSNFHKDNLSTQDGDRTEPVLHRMQNLLCKNFKSIPCEMIMQDMTLRKLIEKSIQQINYKKLHMEKTTQPPKYLTLFPVIRNDMTPRKKKKDKEKKGKKERNLYNRKKLRKFYPHKIKYKDKFDDYDDKLSMSVEIPEVHKNHPRVAYKNDDEEPVWRIDYMKHEEPSANMFGYEDRLKDKIFKSGQNVIMDEVERKDVIHPDLYIKKSFARKNLDVDDDI